VAGHRLDDDLAAFDRYALEPDDMLDIDQQGAMASSMVVGAR
jgi:hypothetical protein